jgi:hypothetical protein
MFWTLETFIRFVREEAKEKKRVRMKTQRKAERMKARKYIDKYRKIIREALLDLRV